MAWLWNTLKQEINSSEQHPIFVLVSLGAIFKLQSKPQRKTPVVQTHAEFFPRRQRKSRSVKNVRSRAKIGVFPSAQAAGNVGGWSRAAVLRFAIWQVHATMGNPLIYVCTFASWRRQKNVIPARTQMSCLLLLRLLLQADSSDFLRLIRFVAGRASIS